MRRPTMSILLIALGVALTASMVDREFLLPRGKDFQLTAAGEAFLAGLGVNLDNARNKRRVFARQCLDWSERRPHLGGALGAVFAQRFFDLRWLRRIPEGRALAVTPKGRKALAAEFDVKIP